MKLEPGCFGACFGMLAEDNSPMVAKGPREFEALCRSEHGGFALYHAYICVPSALYSTLLTL